MRLPLEANHVYDLCAKSLAREPGSARHNYRNHAPGDSHTTYAEAWRFPAVESWAEAGDPRGVFRENRVTFVLAAEDDALPGNVSVAGTFGSLQEPIPMERVEDSRYWAVSLKLPLQRRYHYKFLVDGQWQADPINPQREARGCFRGWSVFFTWACTLPVVFEEWECLLLSRMVEQILPLNPELSENAFLHLRQQQPFGDVPFLYRFDDYAGAVNFIDKLVAREECHNEAAYHICLKEMARLLRQRDPYDDLAEMPGGLFAELYDEMANADRPVAGWDYGKYQEPCCFINLLRRHVMMGAFSHPKYGGNAAASGWRYLEHRYQDADGKTLFDWRASLEQPLGRNERYRG